jgi:uncharacterized protein YbaR (Trm112 family)
MSTLLACPSCHKSLILDKSHQFFACQHEKLQFPIKDGIPVLIIKDAKPIEA